MLPRDERLKTLSANELAAFVSSAVASGIIDQTQLNKADPRVTVLAYAPALSRADAAAVVEVARALIVEQFSKVNNAYGAKLLNYCKTSLEVCCDLLPSMLS